MACPVCELIERDLQDVGRALEGRKAARIHAPTGTETELELEIRALDSAKAQIESRYSKHRLSAAHCRSQSSEGLSFSDTPSFTCYH